MGPVVAKSGEGKDEGFLLATVEKKQSYLLESLACEGIFSKVFPDPVGVNPFFVSAQVYSPEEPVTKEKVFTTVTEARKKPSDPLSKILVCDPKTVTEPCSPYGLNRVIRMARLDSLRAPEHRSAVFTLLEKIGLTSDVFPVSRFFYKVRLISARDLARQLHDDAHVRVNVFFRAFVVSRARVSLVVGVFIWTTRVGACVCFECVWCVPVCEWKKSLVIARINPQVQVLDRRL